MKLASVVLAWSVDCFVNNVCCFFSFVTHSAAFFLRSSSESLQPNSLCFVSWCRFRLYSLNTAIVSWHSKHTALLPVLPKKYLCVHSSLNTRDSSPLLRFFGGFVAPLNLEIYRFYCCKDKIEMKQTNRKSAYLHCLRTRIDVAALMENTRRIFGRAQEANLSSRRVFLNVLAGHKKLCGGPHVARGPQFSHPWPRLYTAFYWIDRIETN